MSINPAMVAQFEALRRQQAQAEHPLLDVKAGRLTLKADGVTVTADPRRGRLQLIRGEDNLLHLKWVLRPGAQVELDRMVLPGAATVEPVPECKDGRVWLVRLDGSKLFFWLQEPSVDKDKEHLELANKLFRERPEIPADMAGGDDEDELDPALLAALGGGAGGAEMDENAQLMQILEQSRREAQQGQQQQQQQQQQQSGQAGAASGGLSSDQARLFAQQLQNLAAAYQVQQEQADRLRLTDVLKSERVAPLLDDDLIKELSAFLPPTQQSPDDLRQQLSCPQLRQALGHLQQLCSSAEYHQLLLSLQLPVDSDMGAEGFLAALQVQADKEKAEQGDGDDSAMKDDEE